MALFSRKNLTCPLCSHEFGKDGVSPDHFFVHVQPVDDGGSGYMYECPKCGERDGVWDKKTGGLAGIMLHCQQKHGLPL